MIESTCSALKDLSKSALKDPSKSEKIETNNSVTSSLKDPLKDLSKSALKELQKSENIYSDFEELLLREIQNELDMKTAGTTKFMQKMTKARQQGREETTSYGTRLIAGKLHDFGGYIDEWVQSHKGRKGKPPIAVKYIECFSDDYRKIASLALRGFVHAVTTEQPVNAVAVKIGHYIEDELRLLRLRSEDKIRFGKVMRALGERGDYSMRHNVVQAVVADMEWADDGIGDKDRASIGLTLLVLMQECTGMFEWFHAKREDGRNSRDKRFFKYMRPTAETMKWIEENIQYVSQMCPVKRPMLVPPLPWGPERIVGGGYVSVHVPKEPLVKRMRGEVTWNALRQADMPEVFDAVNAAQNVGMAINKPVLKVLQAFSRSNDAELCKKLGIPTDQDIPFPIDREFDTEEELKHHKRQKAEIYRANAKLAGHRLTVATTLANAEIMKDEDEFFIPHNVCFRGRIYALTAGSLNPQGPDYVKSLLQFSRGKAITEAGIPWLKMHVANLFGRDKISLKDRVKWVDDNHEELMLSAIDPINHHFWIHEGDKPWQALAAIKEYARVVSNGPACEVYLGCALDGSCSGLQHLAMAFKCEETGSAVNLTPEALPQDIYQRVADLVTERLGEISRGAQHKQHAEELAMEALETYAKDVACIKRKAKRASFIEEVIERTLDKKEETPHHKAARLQYWDIITARAWLDFCEGKVGRKLCKRGVMTFAYGSKEFGMIQQVKQDTMDTLYRDAKQLRDSGKISTEEFQRLFPFNGDGHHAGIILGRLIFESVQRVVVKAAEAMDWMQAVARMISKSGAPIRWTTPTGFPVVQDYRDTKMLRVETLIHNSLHSLQLRNETLKINVNDQTAAVSPNVVHSLDASHLVKTVCGALDEGIDQFMLVHDSFAVPFADTPRFFQIIREQMVEMYEAKVFEDIAAQLVAQVPEEQREDIPPLPEMGSLDRTAIKDSLYAFA